jgi:hydrogenase maturation protease
VNAVENNQVLVIGVGNEFRRDDGAGLHVAREIAKLAMPGIVVREESGEGAALMEAWKGFDRVFAVDATSSGSAAGTVHRLDAREKPIPSEFFHYSTHAFSLAEAVELSRELGCLPPMLVVYGIEGKTFSAGQGLSETVRKAADVATLRIQQEIAEAPAHASYFLDATRQS